MSLYPCIIPSIPSACLLRHWDLSGVFQSPQCCHRAVPRAGPGGLRLGGACGKEALIFCCECLIFLIFFSLLPSGHLHQGFKLPGLLQHDERLSDPPGTQRKRRQKEIGAVEPRDMTWLRCHMCVTPIPRILQPFRGSCQL